MQANMINLDRANLSNAIARAKQIKPRVRMIANRLYSVTGSKNNEYTVKLAVANGKRLGCCDCKAGMSGHPCFHLAAAAQVNIMVQSMRRAAQAA